MYDITKIEGKINERIKSAKWHQIKGYSQFAASNIDMGYESLDEFERQTLNDFSIAREKMTEMNHIVKSLRNKLNFAIDEIAEL